MRPLHVRSPFTHSVRPSVPGRSPRCGEASSAELQVEVPGQLYLRSSGPRHVRVRSRSLDLPRRTNGAAFVAAPLCAHIPPRQGFAHCVCRALSQVIRRAHICHCGARTLSWSRTGPEYGRAPSQCPGWLLWAQLVRGAHSVQRSHNGALAPCCWSPPSRGLCIPLPAANSDSALVNGSIARRPILTNSYQF